MRKHDNFTYNYGWKTAPEQWSFYYNGKLIELDHDIRNSLACMCLSGKVTEAENELKRIIRKQQHNNRQHCCIGFFAKNSKEYYFTKQLIADKNNLSDMLRTYKEWKQHVMDHKCRLKTMTETTGYITPYGRTEGKETDLSVEIDINRPLLINIRYA